MSAVGSPSQCEIMAIVKSRQEKKKGGGGEERREKTRGRYSEWESWRAFFKLLNEIVPTIKIKLKLNRASI